MRVPLLNDHVNLGREDVFVQGEVAVVAVTISHTNIRYATKARTGTRQVVYNLHRKQTSTVGRAEAMSSETSRSWGLGQ